jgi:hypothetical protein
MGSIFAPRKTSITDLFMSTSELTTIPVAATFPVYVLIAAWRIIRPNSLTPAYATMVSGALSAVLRKPDGVGFAQFGILTSTDGVTYNPEFEVGSTSSSFEAVVSNIDPGGTDLFEPNKEYIAFGGTITSGDEAEIEQFIASVQLTLPPDAYAVRII